MAATIKIKNSSTAGAAPTSSDLVQGELAVNVTDKRLFTENASGTVVELGTNPTILTMGAAGSASAPVITRTGDTNTGIFFPAADTIAFAEGGTEAMRLDSSGNMGLGVTPSAWASGRRSFQVSGSSANYFMGANANGTAFASNFYSDGTNNIYSTNGFANMYLQSSGQHQWFNAASGTAGNAITFTQAMTLDASGNLGVGTTSPSYRLHVYNSSASTPLVVESTTNTYFGIKNSSQTAYIGAVGTVMSFENNGAERARITSGGLFKVVNSGSTIENSTGGVNEINTAANDTNTVFRNTASSLTGARAGIDVVYTASTPNGTTANFYNASDATAKRFEVRSNGGIGNYSANNVNLSDRREKTNFAPAGDYLAKICAIPVQTYNYIDQNLEEDDGLTLGVVAQDVQAVAPELVTESNWGSEEEPKMRLSIYQTDLQYALMKCIQEQQAIITQLQADVASLKGQA